MKIVVITSFFIGSLACASAVLAQSNRTIPVEVVVRGCVSCHGAEGQGGTAIPPLAGQDAAWLAERLRAFRDVPDSGTIMPRLMASLSEDDIAALAAWFAELPQ